MFLGKRKNIKVTCSIILKVIFLLVLFYNTAGAVGRDELRLKAGLDLFPSLLTADLDILKKQEDGYLTIVFLYRDNRKQASMMAKDLAEMKKIREIPIRIEITDDPNMEMYKNKSPAGIFITQRLDNKLSNVVDYAVKNSVILFSPFKGDVEKGVMGGISISDRVRPYINKASMESSKIKIKQFYMRVSLIYEP